MAWYSEYKGKSIGRVLFFLTQICGVRIADSVFFEGDGKITYHGKPFATYEWQQEGEDWLAIFTFLNNTDDTYWADKQQRLLSERKQILSTGKQT